MKKIILTFTLLSTLLLSCTKVKEKDVELCNSLEEKNNNIINALNEWETTYYSNDKANSPYYYNTGQSYNGTYVYNPSTGQVEPQQPIYKLYQQYIDIKDSLNNELGDVHYLRVINNCI